MLAIYIIDTDGRVLFHFDYQGKTNQTIPDKFINYINQTDPFLLPNPVFNVDGLSFSYIYRFQLYFVSVSNGNSNVAVQLSFLSSLVKLLCSYLGNITGDKLVENYYILSELFDEVIDSGYPQITDKTILDELINKESMKKYYEIKSFDCNLGPLIRDVNIMYQKNEIKLEVVEQLNVLISKNQSIIKNEIIGEVKVIPHLSKFPIIYLGINNLSTYWSKNDYIDVSRNNMELDDIQFYNTVKFDDYDKNIIRFIPPDNEFVLIKYKKSSKLDPLITIETITKRLNDSRIELIFDARSHFSHNFIAQNVLFSIPIVSDDESIDFKTSIGDVKYLKNENKLNWLITQFPGKEQFLLHVYVKLNSVDNKSKEIRSIKVNFEIPSMASSRINISYLNVSGNADYKVSQTISYVTKVQNYEILI